MSNRHSQPASSLETALNSSATLAEPYEELEKPAPPLDLVRSEALLSDWQDLTLQLNKLPVVPVSTDASEWLEFARAYEFVNNEIRNIFPKERNSTCYFPPEDAASFIELFHSSPIMHQFVTRELLSLIQEIRGRDFVVNDKVLFLHQRGHLAWTALSLCQGENSPESVLLIGPAGSGKTLVLGTIMQAFARLQQRGIITGNFAYATQKGFHLTQQVLGSETQIKQVTHHVPFHLEKSDLEPIRAYIRQKTILISDDGEHELLIPKSFWQGPWKRELFVSDPAAPEGSNKKMIREFESLQEAEALFEGMLAEAGILAEVKSALPDYHDLLHGVGLLLSGRATVIRDIDRSLRYLELQASEIEEEDPYLDTSVAQKFGGDAAFGIPTEYERGGKILIRGSWLTPGQERMTRAELQEQREAPPQKVLFLPGTDIITSGKGTPSHYARNFIAGHLCRTVAVVVDEADKHKAQSWSGAVKELREQEGYSSEQVPLVIAATHLDRDVQKTLRTYDLVSPSVSQRYAINTGTLPSYGVHIFPGSGELSFEPSTKPGIAQFVSEFFKDMELYAKLGLRQPWQRNALIIAPFKQLEKYASALREAYAEKAPLAEIISFKANTNVEYSKRVQAWLGIPSEHPKAIISTPGLIEAAFDWRGMETIAFAANTARSPKILRGLLGRLAHSDLHLRSKNPDDRACALIHLAKGSTDREKQLTPFHITDHPHRAVTEESFSWVPCQALLSDSLYARDLDQIASGDFHSTTVFGGGEYNTNAYRFRRRRASVRLVPLTGETSEKSDNSPTRQTNKVSGHKKEQHTAKADKVQPGKKQRKRASTQAPRPQEESFQPEIGIVTAEQVKQETFPQPEESIPDGLFERTLRSNLNRRVPEWALKEREQIEGRAQQHRLTGASWEESLSSALNQVVQITVNRIYSSLQKSAGSKAALLAKLRTHEELITVTLEASLLDGRSIQQAVQEIKKDLLPFLQ